MRAAKQGMPTRRYAEAPVGSRPGTAPAFPNYSRFLAFFPGIADRATRDPPKAHPRRGWRLPQEAHERIRGGLTSPCGYVRLGEVGSSSLLGCGMNQKAWTLTMCYSYCLQNKDSVRAAEKAFGNEFGHNRVEQRVVNGIAAGSALVVVQ